MSEFKQRSKKLDTSTERKGDEKKGSRYRNVGTMETYTSPALGLEKIGSRWMNGEDQVKIDEKKQADKTIDREGGCESNFL